MRYGHSHIQDAFERLASRNGLGHAYLFFGDRGVGKATFARALAHRIERGSFEDEGAPLADMIWCAPNEKGSIGVDEARAVKSFLWQTPFHSPKRIAVVDGAECLTPEAQGALLKIVEEPPAHGLLIMIAADIESLLPPLVSRAARVYFRRFSRTALADILVSAYGAAGKEAARISARAFGSLGRASGLLRSEPKEKDADEDASLRLIRDLEREIVARYEEDPLKHAARLRALLSRLASLSRYNLNPSLQRKAVEYEMQGPYN